MKPDWTQTDTVHARTLRDGGMSYEDIASQLDRTAKGVKRRLQYAEDNDLLPRRPRRQKKYLLVLDLNSNSHAVRAAVAAYHAALATTS